MTLNVYAKKKASGKMVAIDGHMIEYNKGVSDVLIKKLLALTVLNNFVREIAKNTLSQNILFSINKSNNCAQISHWHIVWSLRDYYRLGKHKNFLNYWSNHFPFQIELQVK